MFSGDLLNEETPLKAPFFRGGGVCLEWQDSGDHATINTDDLASDVIGEVGG